MRISSCLPFLYGRPKSGSRSIVGTETFLGKVESDVLSLAVCAKFLAQIGIGHDAAGRDEVSHAVRDGVIEEAMKPSKP